MKTLSILFLSWQLILLTGCSATKTLQLIANPTLPLHLSPVNIPNSLSHDIPELEKIEKPSLIPQNVIPIEEEFISSLETEESIPSSSIEDRDIIPPTIENESLEPSLPLYLENGIGRDYYETLPYLACTDTITIHDGVQDYATVHFNQFKIIEDANGSGRQGIALFFTEKNISQNPIEVGLPGRVLNPVVNISVFYGQQELKKMPADELSLQFADQKYLIEQHVQFTKEQANMEPCSISATLNPGESRTCYYHYSYAGEGEYLINQAVDPTYSHYRSFLIEIK